MGVHFYDECSDSIETQHRRIAPARAVADAGISCVIWAEDAMSFAYFVPTGLFALQILVPDELVEKAAIAISTALSYHRAPPDPDFLEYTFYCREGTDPHPFSDAPYLLLSDPQDSSKDDPQSVIVHPQSYFHFVLEDPTRTISLVPPLPTANAALQFPTLPAFLDALIDTRLDPTIGYRHRRLDGILMTYISYLTLYTFRGPGVDGHGCLLPHPKFILNCLKPENRPFLEHVLLSHFAHLKSWMEYARERREAMKLAS